MSILGVISSGPFLAEARAEKRIVKHAITIVSSQLDLDNHVTHTNSLEAKDTQVNEAVSRGRNLLGTSGAATLIQTIDVSAYTPPSPDPAGIAYINSSDTLLFSDSEVNEMPIFTGDNLFEIERTGNLVTTTTTITYTLEPTGLAYNPNNNHIYITDDDRRDVYEFDAGLDNLYGTGDDIVSSFDTSVFGSTDPEGITYDTLQNVLYIAEGKTSVAFKSEVFRVSPGANEIFDGVAPSGDDQVSHFDTESWGITDPEGIAHDPASGNLYVIGKHSIQLAEFDTSGVLVRLFDISTAGAVQPAGLAYGPGSQNPSQMSIYIVDRGVDNNRDPEENDGKIYEMVLPPVTPGNSPPVMEAGNDQIITLPDVAHLEGSIDGDDGIPNPPGSVSVTWIKVSGPGTVKFANEESLTSTASFSVQGEYVLRLRANDGELIGADDLKITVEPPPNAPPVVDAGPDQVVTLPDNALLDGTVTDDPFPPVTTTWSMVDGPNGGVVTFGNPNNVDTTASFSIGSYETAYTLRLTADDGEYSISDDVIIIVYPATNLAPVVDAGQPQTVLLSDGADLFGTVDDDGLPDPPGEVTTTWSKFSGPGEVTFGNVNQLETTANFSELGIYMLSLTAYDGALSSSGYVTITVISGNKLWLPMMIK